MADDELKAEAGTDSEAAEIQAEAGDAPLGAEAAEAAPVRKKVQIPIDRADLRRLKEKAGGEGRKKKRKKKKLLLLIILIVVVLAIGGAVALQLLGIVDLLGIYTKWKDENIGIEQRTAELDTRERELAAKEAELTAESERLDALSEQLGLDREAASLVVEINFEEYYEELTEEKIEEIKRVGAIYSKMDPLTAAEILSVVYDSNDVSVIIYYMKPSVAAQVLANLDTRLAATVTQNLVR